MAKKTYKVVGPFPTYDTEPGGTFTRELDPDHEQMLVDQGAIKVVPAKAKADEKAGSSSSGASDTGGGS